MIKITKLLIIKKNHTIYYCFMKSNKKLASYEHIFRLYDKNKIKQDYS